MAVLSPDLKSYNMSKKQKRGGMTFSFLAITLQDRGQNCHFKADSES
jgi:hypothetical protein